MSGAPSFGVTGAAVSSPRPSALRREWTSGRARVSKGPHGTQQFSRSDFLGGSDGKDFRPSRCGFFPTGTQTALVCCYLALHPGGRGRWQKPCFPDDKAQVQVPC